MTFHDSRAISIRAPTGSLAYREEVFGRVDDKEVGDRERANRRPEGDDWVGNLAIVSIPVRRG